MQNSHNQTVVGLITTYFVIRFHLVAGVYFIEIFIMLCFATTTTPPPFDAPLSCAAFFLGGSAPCVPTYPTAALLWRDQGIRPKPRSLLTVA